MTLISPKFFDKDYKILLDLAEKSKTDVSEIIKVLLLICLRDPSLEQLRSRVVFEVASDQSEVEVAFNLLPDDYKELKSCKYHKESNNMVARRLVLNFFSFYENEFKLIHNGFLSRQKKYGDVDLHRKPRGATSKFDGQKKISVRVGLGLYSRMQQARLDGERISDTYRRLLEAGLKSLGDTDKV